MPDTRRTPRLAFKPSREDFSVPGPDALDVWELPIAGAEVPHEIDGTLSVRKLLLGMQPEQARIICQANADLPLIGADCRTDVLTHPETARRFKEVVENLDDYVGRPIAVTTRSTVCDLLDNGSIASASATDVAGKSRAEAQADD